MNRKESRPEEMGCGVKRRNFSKIPVITAGFLLGSTVIPPLTQIAPAATAQGALFGFY